MGIWRHCGLAAVLVLLALSASAEPNWRFAEWGMSKQALLAASDGAARPHYEPNPESWGEYPAAKMKVRELGHDFEAWYFIDPYDGLYAIRLVPQGWYWCIDVREQAMRRWGYRDLRYEDQNPTWQKPARNNRISILGLGGCSIKLEPLDPTLVEVK